MLSRVFTSSALLSEPSSVAHALNAIGLCAKLAIIVGVKPMFFVNASSVAFDSAGTCSGVRAVVLDIVVFLELRVLQIERGPCGDHPLVCFAPSFDPESQVEASPASSTRYFVTIFHLKPLETA